MDEAAQELDGKVAARGDALNTNLVGKPQEKNQVCSRMTVLVTDSEDKY